MPAIDDARESGAWTFDDLANDEPEEGVTELALTAGEVAVLRDLFDYIGQRITDGTARASALALVDFRSLRDKVRALEVL